MKIDEIEKYGIWNSSLISDYATSLEYEFEMRGQLQVAPVVREPLLYVDVVPSSVRPQAASRNFTCAYAAPKQERIVCN